MLHIEGGRGDDKLWGGSGLVSPLAGVFRAARCYYWLNLS